jgi:hypothetical protein
MDAITSTDRGIAGSGDDGTDVGGSIDGPGTAGGAGAGGVDTHTPQPARQPGDIGDALGHDLSNLGDDVAGSADRTFPDPEVSDRTF